MRTFLATVAMITLGLIIPARLLANDGAFRASGNQLVPVFETNISVKKEILSLKKVRNEFIEVTVYYEFFNPGEEKNITVGFEAFSPMGDVDGTPKNGEHPYIRDFTVQVNGAILTYNIAYVTDSLYAANGVIKSKKLKEVEEGITDQNYVDFYYVYHFNARFKKGLNIIKHTYSYNLSNSVEEYYSFNYVLTAAKRWANRQIDDFTLVLDMGEFETFEVEKTFFKNESDWLVNGLGKTKEVKDPEHAGISKSLKFHLQKGNIIFQKRNFAPAGELFVTSRFDHSTGIADYVPFSYYNADRIPEPANDLERRILRNLPFARRGYVFQNEEIQRYFEKMDWYLKNPNYVADMEMLTEMEKEWIKKWKM